MTHFYTATHSSGLVHLRKSERPYTHAAVTARRNDVSWASRLDLATKSADQMRKWNDAVEVVAAVEVDSKEFARLTKASKRAFKTVFMGKTYTKTIDASATTPVMFAVGIEKIAHVSRESVPANWLPAAESSLAYFEELHAKFGRHEDAIARGKARVEEVKAQMAAGYYEVQHRASVDVVWVANEKHALETIAKHNLTAAFSVATMLEVREV